MHYEQGTSHVLHLLLSVITVGVWLPIWALVAIDNHGRGQCSVCGEKRRQHTLHLPLRKRPGFRFAVGIVVLIVALAFMSEFAQQPS